MKRLRIVLVFVLLALAPAPLVRAGAPPDAPAPEVATATGQGFWDSLACGACLGGFVALTTMGWGAVSGLVFTVGDGACIDACIAAF